MKFSKIKLGRINNIDVKPEMFPDFGSSRLKGLPCLVTNTAINGIQLKIDKKIFEIEGINKKHQKELEDILERNLPFLTWCCGGVPSNKIHQTLQIQIHTFGEMRIWNKQLKIGVDEIIETDIDQRFPNIGKKLEDKLNWLNSELILKSMDGEPDYILCSASPNSNEYKDAFRIYGDKIAIDVQLENDKYLIKRIVKSASTRASKDKYPVFLIEGNISFDDFTVVGMATSSMRAELKDIVFRSKDSYFALWNDYLQIEIDQINEKKEKFGKINYSKYSRLPDGLYSFSIENEDDWGHVLDNCAENISLEAIDRNTKLSVSISGAGVQKNFSKKEKCFLGNIKKVDNSQLSLLITPHDEDQPGAIPEQGALVLSTFGEKISMNRRERALGIIKSDESPMPQLGLIIEKRPVPAASRRAINPNSPRINQMFAGGKPNKKQEEALKVALNTPDIGLIVGPPGTGKTQVISALCQRLAEVASKNGEEVSKMTLLTAYQRDAVANVGARTKIYGLPILITDRKKSNSNSIIEESWKNDYIEELEKRITDEETPLDIIINKVENYFIAYLKLPSDNQKIIGLLKNLTELSGSQISGTLDDQIIKKLQLLRQNSNFEASNNTPILRCVHNIPLNEIQYSDDGPLRLNKLLKILMAMDFDETNPEEYSVLKKMTEKSELCPDDFSKLSRFKNLLIDTFKEKKTNILDDPIDESITELFKKVISELKEKKTNNPRNIDTVLATLVDDIVCDPKRLKKTLEDYQVALASTVQQAAGKVMSQIKGDDPDFDNVIIDEAARANPLDILIPMAKAKKRIILVGDHYQLPHMLEPSVERVLKSSTDEALKEAYQKSLFERLVNQLKEQEKKDGIPRVVMLNEQYRSHPSIGDFISKTFYERKKEAKVNSPEYSSEELKQKFDHGIQKYKEKCGVWLNIPQSGKSELEHGSKSKYREVEAKVVVTEVKDILDKNSNLSIGIISFYAAQVQKIWKELTNRHLAEKNEEGEYEIVKQYQVAIHDIEQLCVGTVDSYQGKEFDVVILSVTRCNATKLSSEEDKSWKQKYGFLLLDNRLNVAMSRAKKLLIVAGDSEMVTCQHAKKAVPGLYGFWRFAGNEGIWSKDQKGGGYGLRI